MKNEILIWCNDNGIHFHEHTPYHCRLTKKNIIVDFYWVNQRYHIIKHPDNTMEQNRGGYTSENYTQCLESFFINY